jgi:hypothetical protein
MLSKIMDLTNSVFELRGAEKRASLLDEIEDWNSSMQMPPSQERELPLQLHV